MKLFEFDALHRIMTGQALTPGQLRVGGIFILVWFFMDLLQFFGLDGIMIGRWVWGGVVALDHFNSLAWK